MSCGQKQLHLKVHRIKTNSGVDTKPVDLNKKNSEDNQTNSTTEMYFVL